MLSFNPKNILVPIDLSQISEKAILYAKSIAQIYKSKLHICYIIESMESVLGYTPSLSVEQLDQIDFHARSEAELYFEHLKNKFFNDFSDIVILIDKGIVYKKILELSSQNKIDLIVMGMHGKNKVESFIFGSNTEKILRLAKQQILILKD